MPFIPGSNNGEWGLNKARGAMFPSNMGGFYQGFPLPINLQMPTGTVGKPYLGRAFGRRMGTVYELTPGGVTTEAGWGFKDRTRAFGTTCGPFGYSYGRRRSRCKSDKRCLAKTKNNKRCKHYTKGKFCKHHKNQEHVSRKRSRRSRRSRSRRSRSKKST